MKREQEFWLAGGALLLLGAVVLGVGRIGPAPADDTPMAVDSGKLTRRSTPTSSGNGALPGTMPVHRPDFIPGSVEVPDPEDSPEFFAALAEEARPVLADQLREAVTREHRRVVNRELASLQRAGRLTDSEADSVRRQLGERFAVVVAADVEAVNAGTDAFAEVWNDRLTRADEWAAETRAAARKLTSPNR
jgi:hypothetical protein